MGLCFRVAWKVEVVDREFADVESSEAAKVWLQFASCDPADSKRGDAGNSDCEETDGDGAGRGDSGDNGGFGDGCGAWS